MQLLLVIIDQTVISAPTSPSNLSTNTLVASSGSDSGQDAQIHPPVSSTPQPDSTEYPCSQSPSKGSSPKTSPSRTSPSKITSPSKTTPSHEYIHKESERCVIQFSIYGCVCCVPYLKCMRLYIKCWNLLFQSISLIWLFKNALEKSEIKIRSLARNLQCGQTLVWNDLTKCFWCL